MAQRFIPIILGIVRQGRMSEVNPHFIRQPVTEQPEVETELIDIHLLPVPLMIQIRMPESLGFQEQYVISPIVSNLKIGHGDRVGNEVTQLNAPEIYQHR